MFRLGFADTREKREALSAISESITRSLKDARHIGRALDYWSIKKIDDLDLKDEESIRYTCLAADYSLMIATTRRCVISKADKTIIPTNTHTIEFYYTDPFVIEHQEGRHLCMLDEGEENTKTCRSIFDYGSLPLEDHEKIKEAVNFLHSMAKTSMTKGHEACYPKSTP